MSSEEINKALVRRFFEEVANQGNLDVADELLAPDFVDHDVIPEKVADIEDVKGNVAELQASFSDYHFSIEEQVAEGDKVVTRTIYNATHDQEEYRGVIPSGARITMETVTIHRVIEGKIVEARHTANTAGFWQQRLQRERIERARIEQELEVARSIQQASLPKEVPTLEGWEISPYYQPAREVRGDFYDFHLLSDGRLGLVTGDATGKGVPAALVMSTICGMLQLAAQALDSSSPGAVLSRVNETLVARIPPNMFVTCFYAILTRPLRLYRHGGQHRLAARSGRTRRTRLCPDGGSVRPFGAPGGRVARPVAVAVPLETSLPGVFAAGDVRSGSIKRCASAVGEGSMAVRLVHQYLAHG